MEIAASSLAPLSPVAQPQPSSLAEASPPNHLNQPQMQGRTLVAEPDDLHQQVDTLLQRNLVLDEEKSDHIDNSSSRTRHVSFAVEPSPAPAANSSREVSSLLSNLLRSLRSLRYAHEIQVAELRSAHSRAVEELNRSLAQGRDALDRDWDMRVAQARKEGEQNLRSILRTVMSDVASPVLGEEESSMDATTRSMMELLEQLDATQRALDEASTTDRSIISSGTAEASCQTELTIDTASSVPLSLEDAIASLEPSPQPLAHASPEVPLPSSSPIAADEEHQVLLLCKHPQDLREGQLSRRASLSWDTNMRVARVDINADAPDSAAEATDTTVPDAPLTDNASSEQVQASEPSTQQQPELVSAASEAQPLRSSSPSTSVSPSVPASASRSRIPVRARASSAQFGDSVGQLHSVTPHTTTRALSGVPAVPAGLQRRSSLPASMAITPAAALQQQAMPVSRRASSSGYGIRPRRGSAGELAPSGDSSSDKTDGRWWMARKDSSALLDKDKLPGSLKPSLHFRSASQSKGGGVEADNRIPQRSHRTSFSGQAPSPPLAAV